MTKDKLIIKKQAEIIAHFKELFKILGYEIYQPETTSESLFLELSNLQAEEEEKVKYDYTKIRKAGMPCLKGISCNLCEVNDRINFNKCLNNSEFVSDKQLENLGLIEG
jgi:hypothetical protein